jgi:hypothetical protein
MTTVNQYVGKGADALLEAAMEGTSVLIFGQLNPVIIALALRPVPGFIGEDEQQPKTPDHRMDEFRFV